MDGAFHYMSTSDNISSEEERHNGFTTTVHREVGFKSTRCREWMKHKRAGSESLMYSIDSRCHNRADIVIGREEIVALLSGNR